MAKRLHDSADVYANDPLYQAASLGVDVRHFIEKDKVGKYLVKCANQHRDAALLQLGIVDPTDTIKIMALQWDVKMPELFLAWLDEAMTRGDVAQETIEIEDSTYGG